MRLTKPVLTAAVALGLALPQISSAKTLTIGIDLSGSNPLLLDQNFASSAAHYIYDEISTLNVQDEVQILTFGARDSRQNLLSNRVTLSRQNRPKKVAAQIKNLVQTLPNAGELSQSQTNLIAWLEFTRGFDCASGGQIIVLTDGIESSTLVDANQFVQGKTSLPKPEVDLSGCSLTFYGLGAGFPTQSVRHVNQAWRAWAESAGSQFDSFIF